MTQSVRIGLGGAAADERKLSACPEHVIWTALASGAMTSITATAHPTVIMS